MLYGDAEKLLQKLTSDCPDSSDSGRSLKQKNPETVSYSDLTDDDPLEVTITSKASTSKLTQSKTSETSHEVSSDSLLELSKTPEYNAGIFF